MARLTQIDSVPVAEVIVRDRLRPVTEAGVQSLLASIAETGVMKDAIHVRKKKDGSLHLIAGGHRLEVARRLDWKMIEAKVWTDVTDDWARLMEIDDNLAGAEMNALDTAVFLSTRKEVYERIHPQAKAATGAALAAKRWSAADTMSVASFAKSTAEKFGMTDRHVRRLIEAGTKLGPDEVARLRAAPRAVTLKDLTEIAKIGPAPERYDVVARLAEGRAKSAADARKSMRLEREGEAPVQDASDQQFMALMKAWNRAGTRARKRFLLEKGDEVWLAKNKGPSLVRWADAPAAVEDAGDWLAENKAASTIHWDNAPEADDAEEGDAA